MRVGSRYELLHFFIGLFLGVPGETLQYLNCTIANGRLLDERVPSEMLSLENTEIHYLFSFRNGVFCDRLPLPNHHLIPPLLFCWDYVGACGLFVRLLSPSTTERATKVWLGQLCMVLSGQSLS